MRGRLPNVKDSNVASLPGVDPGAKRLDVERAAKAARDLRPRGMAKEAQRVWDRLAPELIAVGRLKSLHVDAFEQYCDVKVQLDKLRKFRDENGIHYTTIGRHGEQHKSYPEIAQYNQCVTQFQQWCTHFGLTPAAEARFNDAQGDLFGSNPFGSLPGAQSNS